MEIPTDETTAAGWERARDQLLALVAKLKKSKVVDVTVTEGLKQVPIVGSWLGALWNKLDGPRKTPDALVEILETLARDRRQFDALAALLNSNQEVVEHLLFRAHGRLGDVLNALVQQQERLSAIDDKLDGIAAMLDTPDVRDALAAAATLEDTAELRAELMKELDEILEGHADGPGYEALGWALLGRGLRDLAEAAFLRANEKDAGTGVLGLSVVYQRRALELLAQDNFGLAEKLITRAKTFVESASRRGIADSLLLSQWGFVLKDLAQRFQGAGQAAKAAPYIDEARKYFRMALAIDERDSNAYDGLGSLAMIRQDHEEALTLLQKAVELEPGHLFAHFNLAQIYLVLAGRAKNRKDAARIAQQGIEAFQTALGLSERGPDMLPKANVAILNEHYGELLARITAKE